MARRLGESAEAEGRCLAYPHGPGAQPGGLPRGRGVLRGRSAVGARDHFAHRGRRRAARVADRARRDGPPGQGGARGRPAKALRARAAGPRRSKWILVEARGPWLGLAVDDVTEVFGVTSAHERQAPKLGPNEVAERFRPRICVRKATRDGARFRHPGARGRVWRGRRGAAHERAAGAAPRGARERSHASERRAPRGRGARRPAPPGPGRAQAHRRGARRRRGVRVARGPVPAARRLDWRVRREVALALSRVPSPEVSHGAAAQRRRAR